MKRKILPLVFLGACLLLGASLVSTLCGREAQAADQAIAGAADMARGIVYNGVGAPRSWPPLTVGTGGSTELSDGSNPVLIPWGGVVNVSCPSLIGTTNVVLACFTMNVGGTVSIANGQNADGVRTAAGDCRWIDAARPVADLRLDRRRLIEGATLYAGFLGTVATIGACNRADTNFHLAPCLVASESTDCGAASTCDIGNWRNSLNLQSISVIAGAWLQLDATASTVCQIDTDI